MHLKQLVLFSTLTACYLELSAHLMDRGLGGLLFALLQYQTDGLGGDKKKEGARLYISMLASQFYRALRVKTVQCFASICCTE